MKVKIKDQDYNVKYTIRSLFIFEEITGKPFKLESTLDNYIFFYSLLMANNPDKTLISWDEFIDELDNNPEILKNLLKYLTEYYKSQNVFETDETDEETGEKKN